MCLFILFLYCIPSTRKGQSKGSSTRWLYADKLENGPEMLSGENLWPNYPRLAPYNKDGLWQSCFEHGLSDDPLMDMYICWQSL